MLMDEINFALHI